MPKLLITLCLVAGAWCYAYAQNAANVAPVPQPQNFWHVLAEVGFQTRKDASGVIIETPVFSKNLKKYDGKKIKLKGFVIPVNEVGDQNKFMLSSLPFNICYFCGAAGPETVIEVECDDSIRFNSKAIWVEGTLYLNDSDPDHHMYVLKTAQLVSL
ncbi:MAG: hypothetical protein WDO15_30620 [Bacteroidota bacterium]